MKTKTQKHETANTRKDDDENMTNFGCENMIKKTQ